MAMILGINGSLREGSYTSLLIQHTLRYARELGAETTLLDLREMPLPLYEAHADYDTNEHVVRAKKLVLSADSLLLGSPEYHGCMSGAMKNFMDFLYREFAGKVAGLVSATGGSQGSGCFDNMRAAVHACHGWTLPYVTSATGRDFNENGELINTRTTDRLQRMARDLATYGPLLKSRFEQDRTQPPGHAPGFAQWLA